MTIRRDVKEQVAQELRNEGWTVFTRGLPEIIAIRPNALSDESNLLCIKIVSDSARVTPEQRDVLTAMKAVGVDTRLIVRAPAGLPGIEPLDDEPNLEKDTTP